MKKHERFLLSTACLLLLNAAHAQAQVNDDPTNEDPDPTEELGGEPTITFGEPGQAIVDASNDRGVIEVPNEGLTFGSKEEVIQWAIDNFNADVSYDENGNPNGAFGRLTTFGKLRYGDENRNFSEVVDDLMLTKLGGKSGVVTIDGEQFCLKNGGCGSTNLKNSEIIPDAFANMTAVGGENAQPKEDLSICDSSNGFCITQSSWRSAFPLNAIAIYRSIGSDVEQTQGGFQTSHHFCWKAGFIPWSCAKHTGSNTMRLDNLYRFDTGVAAGQFLDNGQADNVEDIDIRMWSLFVAVKIKGDVRPDRPVNTAEAQLTGVCGSGSARERSALSRETGGRTSSGNVESVCSSN